MGDVHDGDEGAGAGGAVVVVVDDDDVVVVAVDDELMCVCVLITQTKWFVPSVNNLRDIHVTN